MAAYGMLSLCVFKLLFDTFYLYVCIQLNYIDYNIQSAVYNKYVSVS